MAGATPTIFSGPGKVDSYTSTVYGLIRDQKYNEAIRILSVELQNFPRSRAALSLLGYCYYALQDFRSAAQIYEELTKQLPEVESYRVYYAQCLYKAGLYPEASKACARVDSEQYAQRLLQLQAGIRYEEDDLPGSRALLDQCVQDDPDTLVNYACITFKEGKYEEARRKFAEALAASSYSPETAYNIALCHYKLQQYGPALAILNDIIERGVREHPELSVGSGSDGVEVRSVGNTPVLRETALVEAFNLKAAIQLSLGDAEGAREALADMPPRTEEELDPVTLHNLALAHLDSEPGAVSGSGGGLAGAFAKLNFLLASPPFPPEAFGNLLLLYVRHGYHDLAADVMAENAQLTVRYLSPDLYDFLDASLLAQASPAEAYRRLDALTAGHVEALRRHTKVIQDARLAGDSEGVKTALKAYDDQLEKYIPVLLSMAKIYWDRENYGQVERILRQAAEFASEHESWQLAVAHCYFMQEGKYRDAIRYYEPLVRRHMDGSATAVSSGSTAGTSFPGHSGRKTGGLLDVTAIVLANLCVAYIMTSQNEAAEAIMRAIEREEERLAIESASDGRGARGPGAGGQGGGSGGGAGGAGGGSVLPQVFHLCIVNLVIGTLYCSKGNFDFGVNRVMKSLEPMGRKLGLDTWHYAKRALLALGEGLSKHTVTVRDGMLTEVLEFLEQADKHGKGMAAMMVPPTAAPAPGADEAEVAAAAAAAALEAAKHTVSYEARLLKRIFLKLNDE